MCHAADGETEQIQFQLSYVSVQTTETYPGCKQRFRGAMNDQIGIEYERSEGITTRRTRTACRLTA